MKQAQVTLLLLVVGTTAVAADPMVAVPFSPPTGGGRQFVAPEARSGELRGWRVHVQPQNSCLYRLGADSFAHVHGKFWMLGEKESRQVKDQCWVLPDHCFEVLHPASPTLGHYVGLHGIPWKVERSVEGENYFFLGWILKDGAVHCVWAKFMPTTEGSTEEPQTPLPHAPEGIELTPQPTEAAPLSDQYQEESIIPQRKKGPTLLPPLPAEDSSSPLSAPPVTEPLKPTLLTTKEAEPKSIPRPRKGDKIARV